MKLSCSAAVVAVCAVFAGLAAPSAVAQEGSGLPSGRTDYRTLSDYEADMLALAGEHPNLVRPLTLSRATVEGRAVKGIEITRDVDRRDGKPVLLITGMHHGNEWASGEATMEFGFDLAENARHDRDIARMLGRVRVVPTCRSSTSTGSCATPAARLHRSGRQPQLRLRLGRVAAIPGSGPFSEPETQNMKELISSPR